MKLPTILIDSREQTPLTFTNFHTEVATLSTGDYTAKGLEDIITVERKSIQDLVGSLTSNRERFQREIQRMLAYRSRTLLIIGDGSDPQQDIRNGAYRSQAKPQSILASLASIEAKGVSIKFASTPEAAARWVEHLAWYAWQHQQRAAGNGKPKTPASILSSLSTL